MGRREEIEDWREFERNHVRKWWKYQARLWRTIDNRAVAVAYCEQGFEIVPLWPSSEHPAEPSPHEWGSPERGTCKGECGQRGHGHHDASSDAGWAYDHWTANPAHGIGVRPWVGVAVFDVDARRGIGALAALEAEHGPLPETVTVMSGRGDGGHHRWFDNVPGPVRQKLCPGIDILCHERNFVVVPPSLHWINDRPYTFKEPLVDLIADAPAWLVEKATGPEPPPRPRRPGRALR